MKGIKKWFKGGDIWLDFIIYPFMVFIFVVMLYPFLNVAALAFNDSRDAIRGGIHIWPREFTLANFARMIEFPNLPRAAFNSVLRTVVGTSLGVIVTSLTSYVLSRKDFVCRKLFTILFTVSMYVTGGLIPFFLLIRGLNMMDSFVVYIVPGVIMVWCVILMRTFMDTLPDSLQESARIDGASDFTIYARIIMPLCMPSIATIVLFYSVAHWNDWWTTYIFNPRSPHLSVLQFELQRILQDTARAADGLTGDDMMARAGAITPRALQMAITVVVTVPIIMVYPLIQKYLIKGMLVGSVKG